MSEYRIALLNMWFLALGAKCAVIAVDEYTAKKPTEHYLASGAIGVTSIAIGLSGLWPRP
jgi:hypothetical protein